MIKKDINKYMEMKITNMSQKELIVFLYESSINLMEEAKLTINKGDVPETHLRLNRARNIFLHLLSTLNLEAGGDFAKKLSALYSYFVEKITMANSTKDIQELDDIIPIVNDIKEAWQELKVDPGDEKSPQNSNSVNHQLISMKA